MRLSARGGFTLIEVLLVAVITVILMYSMSLIFQKATLIVGMSEAEIEIRQKARDIFNRLELDLRCAFVDETGEYFEVQGNKLWFMTTTRQNPEGYIARTDLTQVAYKLLNEDESERLLRYKKLIFSSGTTIDAPRLLVRYSLSYLSKAAYNQFRQDYPDQPYPSKPYPDVRIGDDPEAHRQYEDIVADNVTDFRVSFVSENSLKNLNEFSISRIDTYWRDKLASSSRSLPLAVRIRICISDRKNMLSRAFENIICPKYTVAKVD